MDPNASILITAHDDPPPADAEVIDRGLGQANDSAAPLHEVRPLGCFARAASGEVIGGAVGRRWGSCCELQQLWVAPEHRRQGLGARLVRAFEDMAAMRGCTSFMLETFNFQSPGLYASLGWQVAASHAVYPHGIVRHTMLKRLQSSRDPGAVECLGPLDGAAPDAERILRSLPDWFGIEESLLQYVADTSRWPTYLARLGERTVGFATLREHFPGSWELHCIAVEAASRHRGIGRALLSHAENRLRAKGARLLQVKTMPETVPSAAYAQTRRFYDAMGYLPMEIFPALWGPRLPVLQLVKPL